jgi:glycolate oxidase FAD binding subunit
MRSEPNADPSPVRLDGGTRSWTVDGVVAAETVVPSTPQEVAAILAEAAARDLVVAPVGSGTALALGNPPERVDLALSTRNLGGIIDYEPMDLVLSVGAGARLGDVQAVLAEHGQTLLIDPPGGDEATIGGLIATALAGPRRLSAGTLRDLLIGIAVAHPSGTVTKAGGMVVKNVTGFDLPRLYHGSLGTLGVVVSANFKVLPLPRAEASVVAPVAGVDDALAAAARLLETRLQPTALEVARRDGVWTVAVRLAGRGGALRASVAEVAALLGDATTLDGAESAAWWTAYVADQSLAVRDDEVLIRCAVRPRLAAEMVRALAALDEDAGVSVLALFASVALGSVVTRCRPTGESASAHGLVNVRDRLFAVADHVVVLAAPPPWKRGLDVWGPPPETLDVMQALKHQFDPERVLNRGRFVGHI